MIITNHAVERLVSRFDFDTADIKCICGILSNKKAYRTLSHKKGGEHRKFNYKKKCIIAVVKDGMIITFKYTDKEYEKMKREEKGMELFNNVEHVMTVKQVANELHVTERTIQNYMKKLANDLSQVTNKQGGRLLNEKDVTLIKLTIEKNQHIPNPALLPKTDLEKELIIKQAMMYQNEKIINLQTQINEMLPKAEFYDQVTNSKDAIDIGSAAKVLDMGIGRNKLFELLREKKILMDNNQPYQKYIDCEYFRTIEQKYTMANGSTSINIKTVVYQKGLDFIRRVLA